MRTSSALLGVHCVLLLAARRALQIPTYREFFASDAFLRYAFQLGEAGVNFYSAAFFLLAPSFTAWQLTPFFKRSEAVYDHPALQLCVRLFGATEILVASLFAFVLRRENANAFLGCVLAGDVAHYTCYSLYSDAHPAMSDPGVIAHYVIMTAVLYTKVLWFAANGVIPL